MDRLKLCEFAKDTDKLLGIGSVQKVKLVPKVYFQFEMCSEEKAITVEALWKKAFTKLNIIRNKNIVIAG